MDVDAELVQFVKARPLDMNFGTGTGRSDLWVPSARLLTTQSNDPASENSSRDVSYNKQLLSTNANNSKATSAANVRRKASADKIRNTSELRNSGPAFLAAPTSTTTTNNSNNIIMMTSNNNSSNSIALLRSDEDIPTSTGFGLSMLPTPVPAFTEVDERQEQQQRQRTCDAPNTTTTTQITKSSAVRGNCLLSAALFHAHEDDSRSPTCISASSGHLMSFTSLSDGMAHSQKSTTATTAMTTTTMTTSNTQRNSNSGGHRRRVALSELTRKSEATRSRRHTGLAKHSPTSNNSNSSGSGSNNSRMVQGAQTRTPRQYVARNTRRTGPTVAQTERPAASLSYPTSSKAVNATRTTHPHSPPARITKSPSPTTPIASASSAKRITPRVTTTTTTTTSSSLSPVQAGYKILHDSGRCGGVAPQLTSAYSVESTTQAIPSVHLRRSPSTQDVSGKALHSLRSSPSLTRDARSPSIASGHSATSDRPARKAEAESEKRRTVYSVPRKQHCVIRDTGVQPTTTTVTVDHSSEVTPSVTTATATAVNDKDNAHIDGDNKEGNEIVLNTDAERSTPQPLSVPDGMSEALLNASPAASSGLYLKSATVTVSSMTSPTCANTASPAFTHSLDVGRLASTPELTAMPAGGVVIASTNTNGSYLYTAQGTATAATTINSGPVQRDVDHNYHSSISNVIFDDGNIDVKPPGPGVALRDWSTPALAALLASDEVNECDEPVPRRLWPVHYDTSNSSSSREAGVDVSNTNRIGDAKKKSNEANVSNVNKSTVRPGSEKSSAQVAKPADVALQRRETMTPVILREDISKSIQTKTSSVPLSAIHTRTQDKTTSAPASSSSTRLLPTMTSAQPHNAQRNNTNANISSSSISNRRATALDATPSPAKPPARLAPTYVALDETASQHASRAPHDTVTSAAASYKATYSAFRAAVEALDQCHDEDAIPLSPPLRNTPKEDELLYEEGEEVVVDVLVPQRKATARPAPEKAHWPVTTSPAAPFTSPAMPHAQDKAKNLFTVKEQYDKDHTAVVAMGRDESRGRNTQKSVENGHAGPWVPRLPLAELRVPDRDASPVPVLSVLQPVRHEPSQSIQFSVHSDSATQASSEIRESLHDYEDHERYMTDDLAAAEAVAVSPMMMMNGSGVVVDKEGDGVSMSARAAMTDPLSPVPLPQAQMPCCTSNVNDLRNYNGNKGKFTTGDGNVEEEAAVVAARRIRDMALNRFDDGTTNENARHAMGQRDISAAPLSSRQEMTIVSISSLSSSTQGMALRHLAETGPRLSARGHLSARTADSPLGPTTTTNVAVAATNITNDDEEEFVARPIVPPLKWPPPNIAPSSGSAIAGPQLPTYTIVPGTDYPPSLRTSNETSAVDVGESMSTMRPNMEAAAAAANGPDMSSGAAVGAAMSGPAQPPATAAAPYMNGNAKPSMKHSSGQCCSVM